MAAPTMGALSPWHAVREEIVTVLSTVSGAQMSNAAALFTDRRRRWFCSGQGRSGLVAQMVAMRLMHVGFDAHAVGEATAPAIGSGDGLVMISGSGETPVTLHITRLARDYGAHVLAVTTRADSTLARRAHAVIQVPTTVTGQFGGTLFEQSALLLLDAVMLEITAGGSACLRRDAGAPHQPAVSAPSGAGGASEADGFAQQQQDHAVQPTRVTALALCARAGQRQG